MTRADGFIHLRKRGWRQFGFDGGAVSSTPTLTDSGNPHRVPDALGTVLPPVATPTTMLGSLATDIPEDFAIGSLTTVTVPVGASYLFLTGNDSFFGDNTDIDADFQVRITIVPEPSTAVLGMIGCALMLWWSKRRK